MAQPCSDWLSSAALAIFWMTMSRAAKAATHSSALRVRKMSRHMGKRLPRSSSFSSRVVQARYFSMYSSMPSTSRHGAYRRSNSSAAI